MQTHFEIGQEITVQDAAELPDGYCYVDQHGRLLKTEAGKSITLFFSNQGQPYLVVGHANQTPWNVMREVTRQHQIEPKF